MKLYYFLLTLLLLCASNLPAQSKIYDKLFLDAAKVANEKDVVYYLDKGAEINCLDSEGRSALHVSARDGKIEIVNLLLNKGAKVDNLDAGGRTPLMYAAYNGYLRICYLLYQKGANIQRKDKEGYKAQTYAENAYYLRVAGFLANPKTYSKEPTFNEYFSKVQKYYQTENYSKAYYLMDSCLYSLKREIDLNKTEVGKKLFTSRETLKKELLTESFLDAINKNNIDSIKYWINKGASLTNSNRNGVFPIHYAINNGDIKTVELLIESGANINQQDSTGQTPIIYASKKGYLRICHYLYQKGADLNIKDKAGKKAIELANEKGYLRVANFLSNPNSYSETPTCFEYLLSSVKFTEKMEFYEAIKLINSGLNAINGELNLEKTQGGYLFVIQYLNSLANQYIQVGDYNNSNLTIQKSLKLCEKYISKSDSLILYGTIMVLANYQVEVGTLTQAQENYEKSINYYERHPNIKSDIYIRLINSLGLVYQKNGNFLKAEEYFLKALNLQKDTTLSNGISVELLERSRILNNLGLTYAEMRKFDKAIDLFKDASVSVKTNYGVENAYYCTSISNLGYVNGLMGNYEQEKIFLLEALKIEEKIFGKHSKIYSITLNNIGLSYERIRDYKNAEESFLEFLSISETLTGKNTVEYCTALNNLALVYYDLENFTKSEETYTQLQKILDVAKLKENPVFIKFISNYSLLKFKLGQFSEVEKLLQNALQDTEKSIGKINTTYAVILSNIGGYYNEMGSYNKAKQYIEEAINVQKVVLGDSNFEVARSLNILGLCYAKLDMDSVAIEFYEQALDITTKVFGEKNPNLILILNNLAMSNMYMGNYDKSEDYFFKALNIENDNFGNSNMEYAIIVENLSQLYLKVKKYDLVKKILTKSLDITINKLGKEHVETAKSFWNSAEFNLKINNLANAETLILESTKIYKKVIQDNFKFLSESERTLNWDKYEFIFNDHCPSFVYNYYSKKKSISSFAYDNTLFTKGLLLNTSLQIQNAVLQSGDTVLINIWGNLRKLKRQINTLQSKPLVQKGDLSVMEAQADSLDKVLTQKSQLYKQSQSDMQVKWTDVQKNLKPDEAAIEFISFNFYNKHYTDSTMYCALVLKKNSPYPEMIPLFEEKQLDSLFVRSSSDVNQLYTYRVTNLRKDSVESRLNYGSKLYNLLWKPLEASLKNTKTVYYAPSGKLNQVAFSAIPVDSTLLLSDKYNLHQVTSTRQVIHNNELDKQTAKVHEAALFGGIQYELDNKQLAQVQTTSSTIYRSAFVSVSTQRSGSFGYLKGTGEEVTGIAEEFKLNGLTEQLYTGAVASEAAFKKLSGTNTDIIHIATHGFYLPIEDTKPKDFKFMSFDNDRRNVVVHNPLLRSGLAFAGANSAWRGDSIPDNWEDGILTSHEISQLNLTHTDLVVLSACETALGDVKGSEGVFGLQRAFKMAGVQTLIMSLWKVPDTQTSQLMQGFYKYWLDGMNKHDAFKKSQNEIRKANPNPYYWAAFVMVD